MIWEDDFDKELKKLKNALNRILIRSREFQNFRKKLKEWNLDSDISLQMHIVDREDDDSPVQKDLKKIAQADLAFFKRNGIKWD